MHTRDMLAPTGSTGNNTHGAKSIRPAVQALAMTFKVTVAGGTPTVTFKFQGTTSPGDVPDAQADWVDLSVLPSNAAVEVTSGTATAVGVQMFFFNRRERPITRVRLVTSANTNITYESMLLDEAFS